jgi:glycosyltransferase involved in cell wall biosynthesis
VRICVIGKFPPIQGGVSRHTYWSAHALAERGHEVHVVTNAKEVEAPYRMHMRPTDWRRCAATYAVGSVTVHWTDPVDASQFHIPMASPFASKLAAIAAGLHAQRPFDVVYSHYLEPYGVAGCLVGHMTGAPHVVRMAGSDAGRLWHHPQLEPLYDHVLRSAARVVAIGAVAERAAERGVAPDRIAAGGGFAVPEHVFTPQGPALDLASLRAEIASDPACRGLMWGGFAADRPYFGVCGKLGESKGSFALLEAMQRLKNAGLRVGLVALAHGPPSIERAFRARARKLGLVDDILQLPFLPHWRVPAFLRGCLAACCLEQDFPIAFHSPIIAREVLLCGTCLVGSTEVIRKLPAYGRLPHGYGCVAIEDVNDIDVLSGRLAAIVRDPSLASAVGRRGHAYASELQQDLSFPDRLEQILADAVSPPRRSPASPMRQSEAHPDSAGTGRALGADEADDRAIGGRFPLTRIAAAAIGTIAQSARASARDRDDEARAREILAALERRVEAGEASFRSLAAAVAAEIAIAAAESEACDPRGAQGHDPLFRLRTTRWAIAEADVARFIPLRDPRIRVLAFDTDVGEFLGARTLADLPAQPAARRSYVVAFAAAGAGREDPLVVDALTARILQLSDGTRSAGAVAEQLGSSANSNLAWIERLFVHGLISLHESSPGTARAGRSRPRSPPMRRAQRRPSRRRAPA